MVKSLLLTVLFLMSMHAYAEPSERDQLLCLIKGTMYMQAAQFRDQRMEPEYALEMSQRIGGADQVPITTQKEIINAIYFDAGFQQAGGIALRNQMYDLCLNGPTNFAPLK